MKDTVTFVHSAKLGDFIHGLCVCKYTWETTGKKADLLIAANWGDSFENGIEFTYNDLKPIIEKQEWCNSFNIYGKDGQEQEYDVNIVNFRNSPLLCRTNWIEIYFKTFFNIDNPPKEYSWLVLEKDESLKDTVLVNRNLQPMSDNTAEIYRNKLKKHDNVSFICFDKRQYDNFKLKEYPVIYVDNLYDFAVKINSCKLFVGNQSAPMALAVALNVPRYTELYAKIDHIHYMKDIMYYNNYDYFIGDNW